LKSVNEVPTTAVAMGEPKLPGCVETHAAAEMEQRYTLYVTFGVVLAVQLSATFEVPVPDKL